MEESTLSSNEKKVALVTGSTTGIGANIALDLASIGFWVIVTGRSIEKAENVVKQCNELSRTNGHHSTASLFIADLNNLDQVDKLIEFIETKYNRLDVLINNACWRGDSREILASGAFDDLKRVMHLNVSIPVYLINKCFIPLRRMSSSKGIVINISSVASRRVVPLHLYSISKACLSEMTKQLSAMSNELNMTVVTISPGPVLTYPHHKEMVKFTLLDRIADTQDISNYCMFVLNHAETFNGQELLIDGGWSAQQK